MLPPQIQSKVSTAKSNLCSLRTAAPVPGKRGRKKGSKNKPKPDLQAHPINEDTRPIDEAEPASNAAPAKEQAKRGRKKGSTNKPKHDVAAAVPDVPVASSSSVSLRPRPGRLPKATSALKHD